MKFTLSWLKEHLETTSTLDEILDALTDLGLEVEGVEDRGARLKDFTIAKVRSADKHPDADKLKVCQVETVDGVQQIICGAPNAREGITVVLAKPGTYVPGLDITIGVGKIRGIESFGMMASERELELSDEHNGIIELPSGEVGESFVDWLRVNDPAKVDPVIEIAITPNRQDALGIHGIARDLAARGLGALKSLDIKPIAGQFPCPITVTTDDDTLADAPHFAGRLIRNVKNGPSPEWLQDKLRAIGLRPISALVDITNFFTFDQNRPLHVFDADKVKGGLRVNRAKGGEVLTALDEKEYTLSAGQIIISDDTGPESIAGVMGGLPTGCSDDTVNVFLESAWWDPVSIAHTGRALKINSDARYRFERGIDPEHTLPGLDAATQMILDLCGGEPSEIVEVGAPRPTARSFTLRPDRIESLIGMTVSREEQIDILTKLGFSASGSGDALEVWVPSWRLDIHGEADLVEEVARVTSLSKLEPQPLPRPHAGVTAPVLTPMQVRERTARRSAAARGYHECVTYSFIDQTSASLFGGGGDDVMLDNPISSEMSHMRPSLLPGLLQAAARNQARGAGTIALFEAGARFFGGEPGEQSLSVTGLLIGQSGPRDPHGAQRSFDLFDVKADAQAILAAIGAPAKAQIRRGAPEWWHPGRHGMICLGPKKVLAIFGELHPRILSKMDVKGRAVAFEIFPEEIPLPRSSDVNRGAVSAPEYQAVERDFAFVVSRDVAALDLVNAAAGADKELIEDVRVFDEFIGGSLGDDNKSLAITVRLQPTDRTLNEAEIEAVSAKIVAKVTKTTGGTLRA